MKKKVLSLILIMMLGVFVFAGCASDASDQDTATPDETETPDTTAGASMAVDNDSFVKAISADGSWIVLTQEDLTFVDDLIVEGTYIHEGHDGSAATGRSLAFATVNADYSVDQRFTVTTPNFVINSPETLLEYGIIKGDVYVQAPGFVVVDATIDGNLYFATQALKDAFVQDDTTQISGTIDVKAYANSTGIDAVAGASMAVDNASFEKAISADGSWIVLTEQDFTFTDDLIVEGTYIHIGHDGLETTGRALAFATVNADRSVDQRFTVATPNFVINSPETFVEYGIIAGDVYVQAPGFSTYDARIEGNLYFATQVLKDAYVQDDLTQISGSIEVQAYTK